MNRRGPVDRQDIPSNQYSANRTLLREIFLQALLFLVVLAEGDPKSSNYHKSWHKLMKSSAIENNKKEQLRRTLSSRLDKFYYSREKG